MKHIVCFLIIAFKKNVLVVRINGMSDTMTAERFSCSLDSDVIMALANEAAKRGQTKSYLIAKYLKEGLGTAQNLTIAERHRWSKSKIKDSIQGLFANIGMTYDGNIPNSIIILYFLPNMCFNSAYEYNLHKASVISLIDTVREIDIEMGDGIVDSIKELVLKIQKENGNSENSESDMP